MVVALRADDVGAEEDLHGVGEVVELVLITLPEADAAAVPHATISGEQVLDELIIRRVGLELLLEPLFISLGSEATFDVVGEAQDVRPVVEHVAGVAIGGQQRVDQLCALLRIIRLFVSSGFLNGRDAARDVEIEPAHEHIVTGGRIGLHAGLFPAGGQELVDLLALRQHGRRESDSRECEAGKEKAGGVHAPCNARSSPFLP